MEAFASIIDSFAAMNIAQDCTIAFLAILCVGGYHYINNILPRRDEIAAEERAQDREEQQRRYEIERSDKNRMHDDDLKWKNSIKEVQDKTNELLARSDERDEQFQKHLTKLNDNLDQVAMILSSHVETANQTNRIVHDMNEKMPSKDGIQRIHERLDEVLKEVASKEDMQRVSNQLEKISGMLNEVHTRQMM